MTRRLLAALVLVVTLAGCGGSGGAPEADHPSAPGSSRSGAPGQVDIGDRALFLECRGSGRPTVVLDAGLTGDHRTWEDVVPAVQSRTRVCAYDRANVGLSDPAARPRTTQDMVDDLDALLSSAGEKPPYVLVGFSFGGLVAQLYASTHQDDVSGLVLVESNHPDEQRQFESHLTRKQIKEDRASVGGNSEGVDVFTSLREVSAAPDLPEVPLVVVTAGLSEGWPPGWDARLFDRLRGRQQADLAARVPGGRQVFARFSQHDVPNQQPRVVVTAIRDVVSKAR